MWVRSTLQRCIKDPVTYQTVQMIDRVGYVHRSASGIATQMTTFTDPVTQEVHTISGAGVATLIRDLVVAWIIEDRGGALNHLNDIIED